MKSRGRAEVYLIALLVICKFNYTAHGHRESERVMKTYTKEELKEIIQNHDKWINCEGGERADLSYANLSYANLSSADLRYADLSYADLRSAKEDFYSILDVVKTEVNGLFMSLLDGKVNGSTYEGECACLVGTIANVKGVNYKDIPLLKPNLERPAERLFLAIERGDTPDSNPISEIVRQWIVEYSKKNDIKLFTRKVVWE